MPGGGEAAKRRSSGLQLQAELEVLRFRSTASAWCGQRGPASWYVGVGVF